MSDKERNDRTSLKPPAALAWQQLLKREARRERLVFPLILAVLGLSLLSRAWVDVVADFSWRRFVLMLALVLAAGAAQLYLFVRVLQRKPAGSELLTQQLTATYLEALDKSPLNPNRPAKET